MFSLMGKCFSCLRRKTQPRREITLAILGLDNAGKTTATKALLGESLEVAPTIGFTSETIVIDEFEIKIFDLGGGKRFRDIWKQYLTEVYGIIYVVDSSAPDRVEEATATLKALLEHEKANGKPILLLANKQDIPNAMDEVDICERINLEQLVNSNKCPCRIETCSAIKGTGKKMDKNIRLGLKWLCATLNHNWEVYQPRVERDVAEEKERKQKEQEEKRERVRKIREERERQEEEERKRLGIEKPGSDDEDVLDGDPFKRVDVNELTEKEKRLKEEKKKRKELELKKLGRDSNENNIKDNDESDDGEIKSSRSLKYLGLNSKFSHDNTGLENGNSYPFGINNRQYDLDQDSENDLTSKKSRRATPRLPPLQKPLGTKFSEDDSHQATEKKKKKRKKKLRSVQENEEDETFDGTHQQSKHSVQSVSKIEVLSASTNPDISNQNYLYNGNSLKQNKHIVVGKVLSMDDTEEEVTPRISKSKKKKKGKGNHQSFDDFPTTPRSNQSDESVPLPESLNYREREENSNEVRRLKKKAYLKKNKTHPSDEEIEMNETLRESSIRDLSWAINSPKKDSVLSSDDEPVSRNWGFAEDLGDTYKEPRRIGVRPNFDDDNDIL